HRIGKTDEGAALGKAPGLEIVHAARADASFQYSGGQAVVPLPVGDERDGSQMRAGGTAADVEPVRSGAEGGGILVDPGNGASHLGGHRAKVAACLLDVDEVDRNEIRAGVDEHFG